MKERNIAKGWGLWYNNCKKCLFFHLTQWVWTQSKVFRLNFISKMFLLVCWKEQTTMEWWPSLQGGNSKKKPLVHLVTWLQALTFLVFHSKFSPTLPTICKPRKMLIPQVHCEAREWNSQNNCLTSKVHAFILGKETNLGFHIVGE